ncbi:MAG: hypothetical protein ETSY1_27510 [Candidatus Entotheonella factor]|uniref:Uncharacterized protein n=1 Tax=Entotheonella factor TaxID=1429438 RepID=W4LDP7_ENTF1|nr:hypothetical protein [Candidatus Entotheonella palauensis]ETW96218.1 MAG: hypothetical protein ETSY1_27510 [Candidatus Entotheonella factor]
MRLLQCVLSRLQQTKKPLASGREAVHQAVEEQAVEELAPKCAA